MPKSKNRNKEKKTMQDIQEVYDTSSVLLHVLGSPIPEAGVGVPIAHGAMFAARVIAQEVLSPDEPHPPVQVPSGWDSVPGETDSAETIPDNQGVNLIDAFYPPEPIDPGVNLSNNQNAEILKQVAELTARLASLQKAPKNHVPGKPQNVKYVLLTQKLSDWGKVPQQQADLASILSNNLKVGQPVSEAEVFALVEREAPRYESIRRSVQHPTYLLRYYRGLKHDAKHAGFIARGFLKVA
jgi:hypothetical protein